MTFRLIILISSCLLLSSQLFCQNWQPISTTSQTNYRVSPSPTISNMPLFDTPGPNNTNKLPFLTLKIDSFNVIGSDSLFYFNLWTYTKTDTLYPNRAPFLEKEMFKTTNGVYYFYNPDTFSLQTQVGLNQSWVFRSGTQDSATVVDVFQDTVLGQLDSLKLIHLTTGDSIILSKNFGIVHFSDTSNVFYDLVGIESSLTQYIGKKMPNFYDVYNYEVGDQFVIGNRSGNSHPFHSWSSYSISKYTIKTKQTTATTFVYDVEIDGWNSSSVFTGGANTWTHSVTDPTDVRLNSCNGSSPNSPSTIVYEDNLGRLYKRTVYYSLEINLGNEVYTYYPARYTYPNIILYGSNLGQVHRYELDMQPAYDEYSLIGYVKNGVVYGDTAVLSRPVSNVSTSIIEGVNSLDVTVYPQPAKDFISIEVENGNNTDVRIELIDLQGVLRKRWFFTSSPRYQLEIGDIPGGIYILKVENDSSQNIQKVTMSPR